MSKSEKNPKWKRKIDKFDKEQNKSNKQYYARHLHYSEDALDYVDNDLEDKYRFNTNGDMPESEWHEVDHNLQDWYDSRNEFDIVSSFADPFASHTQPAEWEAREHPDRGNVRFYNKRPKLRQKIAEKVWEKWKHYKGTKKPIEDVKYAIEKQKLGLSSWNICFDCKKVIDQIFRLSVPRPWDMYYCKKCYKERFIKESQAPEELQIFLDPLYNI